VVQPQLHIQISSSSCGFLNSKTVAIGDRQMGKKSHRGSRSAIDGQFVKKSYADKHKSTTVNENIPNPGHGTAEKGKDKKGK
jgi:hypothetical protein